ncbi:poly(A)-binding protein binding protein [Elasticomyces elasticus]|nr:poly(A)-binding protein binding protein [Elasticomyces elasticus]
MSTPTAATNGNESGGAAKKGQQQQRGGAAAGKALDGQRKGSNASPAATAAGEGGRKQKAWSGTNPTILPQRSATPNGTSAEKPLPKLPSQAQQQQNNNNTKQQQTQPQPQQEVNGVADKHAHDRLLYVLGNCVGLDATIGLKSGEQFTGVFTGFSSAANGGKYILSMVRRTHAAPPHQQNNENAQTNGHATPTPTAESSEEFIGEGEDHTMAFDVQDTTCLSVDNVLVSAPPTAQQNGTAVQPAVAGTGFMTDTQISSSRAQPGQQRELQRWDAGQDTDVDLSLDSSSGIGGLGGGGIEGWDQFATNEVKFGVGSTYKEEYYTTSIDRSDPGYRRREAEAERIAREMEGEVSNNGRAGRRGEEGLDEEDKYSGVRREGLDTKLGSVSGGVGGSARESANLLPKRKEGAYVPPRERPITGGPAPATNGAPWDPAIIATSKPVPKEAAGAAGATPTIVEPQQKSAQPAPQSASRETQTSQTPRTSQQAATTTAESSTQDHISKTIDAFKLFASNEKLKVRQQQELKRAGARQEKNVKLNDLKKFAANFKLNSRVPDDLVPILAKDREKQVAIQKAAEAAAKEAELSPKKVGSGEGKRGSPLGGVNEGGKVEGGKPAGMGGEVSRGEKLRGAQVLQQQMRNATGGNAQSPRSPAFPQGQQSRNGSSGQHQGFGRGGGAAGQVQGMPAQQQQQQQFHAPSSQAPPSQAPSSSQAPPPPQLPAVRIPDGPAGWQGGAGAPLSPASRFNINAMEFRPIAANLAGTTPSPKRKGSATTNATAVVAEPAQQKMSRVSSDSFFGKGGKPIEEQDRKDADEEYDPVKRMLAQKDFVSEVEKKAVMGNGGVVQPFKTGPTWPGKEGESFLAGFQRQQVLVEQPAMQVAAQALQHQLPPPHHVQGPPPQGMVGTPSQRHQQYFAGGGGNTPQHGGFADPRMMGQQFGGSVQSSPRFQSAQMAGFGGQIPPHMQQQGAPQMPGPQYGGVGGQGYGMSPSMQQRQMMPQQQQQQGMMMQGGPQQYGQANGRFQGRRGSKGGQQQQQQQWGGGPDERGQRGGFPAPQHFGGGGGVPMMQTLSQQGHGGQFMNGPPPANMGGGYSPMPHQAQMQGGYSGSPGRPTMMAHSGSHQGFNPQQIHGMHGGPPPQGPGMQQQQQQQGQPFAMGPGGAHPMHWQQQQRQMSGGYGGGPSPQHSGGMTPRSQQAMPMLQQGGGGGGHSGLNSPAAVGMGQGGEEVKGG